MTTTRPSRLAGFRQRRDEFMRTNEHSPLTEAQKASFVPLDYFEENTDLAFVLEVDTDVPHDPVELPTTTGEAREYIPHGRITFNVDGQDVTLMVYREPERGRLLIPFRDTTNNVHTYGAGRTVDPQERPDGRLSVDFNYAYAPYCQYNDNWVCTVPPMENWLRVPIEAGEKKYPNKESNEAE
ncbi:MAG: DUF1684 domain-containing protein [Thermomicrobiales bacterium]|nr:DUF1684 domain-containing protein [Thermomicrobiales bacterium]